MYYLSLFSIPKQVARRIIQLQRRFFWGKKEGDKGDNLISWEVIQRPLDKGGLGVGDIFLKNASLLFKWWWRFADDQKPLWKEIVRSIHCITNSKSPQVQSGRNQSSIWGQITNFKCFSEDIQEVARKGIRVKVGAGAETRIWFDQWTGEECLKDVFPRLFILSKQKDSRIEEMGKWIDGEWRWILRWRRNLFAWEDELLENLLANMNHIRLKENTRDVRVWSNVKSTSFSVSNFVLQVSKLTENANPLSEQGRLAWRNLAPPRAQLYMWFILQGRLNTRERLFRYRANSVEDDRCALCKDEAETIEHLFFCCKLSSIFWWFCCERWNLSTCLPKEPRMSYLSWMGAPFQQFDKKIWMSMFHVVSWSIWDIRNKIVFHGFKPNWDFAKKRLLWRLGLWIRGWCWDFPFLSRTSDG